MSNELRVLIFVSALAWLGPSDAHAQGAATPAAYIELELTVRELTIAGMRERVALRASSNYTRAADHALDERIRARISEVYRSHETTPGAHLAFGTRERKLIREWLSIHPELQQRYQALSSEFRTLSAKLNHMGKAP